VVDGTNEFIGTWGPDWIVAHADGFGTIGDKLLGMRGNDRLFSYAGGYDQTFCTIDGGKGNDQIGFRTWAYGEAYSSGYGGYGHDILTLSQTGEGGSGMNGAHFDGGWGNDRIGLTLVSIGSYDVDTGEPRGASYDRTFLQALGGPGNDRLTTYIECYIADIPVRNVLDGGYGNDVMSAKTYAPGEDTIQLLHGRHGRDVLRAEMSYGEEGRSILFGGPGNDRLAVIGGEDNVLDGGLGSDLLSAGAGTDEFRFDPARSAGTVDTVIGFDRTRDIIHIKYLSDGIILDVLDDGTDVHVLLFDDNEVVFKGMGTGEVDSVYHLVETPEQISGWVD
jgi:Ca2+-binding RTX toxin-like protein